MKEQEAIQMLATHPYEFLRKHALTLGSPSDAQAAVHLFYGRDTGTAILRPGWIAGNLRRHSGKRFQLRTDSAFGGAPFQAFHLPMQPSNADINFISLPGFGPNLMITPPLSACSIVIAQDSNSVKVAHLRPIDEDGAQLNARLRNSGFKVYGALDYWPGRAAFIGVRQGTWRFYAQHQDLDFNIINVRQLILD